MALYSQRDPRWRNHPLGFSSLTIGGYGCVITSIGNLINKTPLEINDILMIGDGYYQGNLVSSWSKVAGLLNLSWNPDRTKPITLPCLMETDHFKETAGVPQHFVVWLGGNKIVDPLDLSPQPKSNAFNIVSYRNISPKGSIIVGMELSDEGIRNLINWVYIRVIRGVEPSVADREAAKDDIKAGGSLRVGDWVRDKYDSDEAKAYRLAQCPAVPPAPPVDPEVEKAKKVLAAERVIKDALA